MVGKPKKDLVGIISSGMLMLSFFELSDRKNNLKKLLKNHLLSKILEVMQMMRSSLGKMTLALSNRPTTVRLIPLNKSGYDNTYKSQDALEVFWDLESPPSFFSLVC